MKMSDYFELPVDDADLLDIDGPDMTFGAAIAAAEAINKHDQLTGELELLKMKYAAVCAELEQATTELSKTELASDVAVLLDHPAPTLARYSAELLRKAAFKIGRLVIGESDYAKGFNDGVYDKNRIIEDMARELERIGK